MLYNQEEEDLSFISTELSHQTNQFISPSQRYEFDFLVTATMFVPVAVAITVGVMGWVYQCSLKPPPPKICGTAGGPEVTSPRVKLHDGRHLAYKEMGVPKEEAKHKIILNHGYDDSKEMSVPVPQELLEELSIYILTYDRAGNGESDPNPSRTVKSEAYDIEELADKLQIGSKFYVYGSSMGAYPVYGCLKYIPHRLAGVTLVAPFINYWWPCLPAELSRFGWQNLPAMDRRAFYVAHYAPWLFYWWMSQKWFPSFSRTVGDMSVFSPQDIEILAEMAKSPNPAQGRPAQQGIYESLHRDILAGYAKWEFDPMDLTNPFPNGEGVVHMWQGTDDRITRLEINRYLAEKIPWIRYHEVKDVGHLFNLKGEHFETMLRALVHT